jgi:hypothetical protein
MSGLLKKWADLLKAKPLPPEPPVTHEVKEEIQGQMREAMQLNASSARLVGKVATANTEDAHHLAEVVHGLVKARDIIDTARASLELITGGKGGHDRP